MRNFMVRAIVAGALFLVASSLRAQDDKLDDVKERAATAPAPASSR
jgi:hypothetical protein